MIATPPPDPRLRAIATLLDGDAIRGIAAGELAARPGSWTLTRFQPRYIRYKPATSCLVQYAATFRRDDGERLALPAQVKVFGDERGRRRAGGKRLGHLLEQARAGDAGYDGPLSAWLPAIGGLLQVYPVDYDLRGLATVASRGEMTAAFRAGMPGYPDLAVTAEPSIIRYKPERKALFAYELAGGPVPRLYGKTNAVAITERLLRQTDALRAAGVATPRVAVALHPWGFLADEPAPGTTARRAAVGAGVRRLDGPAGRRACPPPGSRAQGSAVVPAGGRGGRSRPRGRPARHDRPRAA